MFSGITKPLHGLIQLFKKSKNTNLNNCYYSLHSIQWFSLASFMKCRIIKFNHELIVFTTLKYQINVRIVHRVGCSRTNLFCLLPQSLNDTFILLWYRYQKSAPGERKTVSRQIGQE